MERFDPARLDARAAIARYADGKRLSKLAPLVEWVADRIDRPAPQRDAIPRGASRGEVRLEPVTRKVLAFDSPARVVRWLPLLVLFVGFSSVEFADESLAEVHMHAWVLASVNGHPWVLASIAGALVCLGVLGSVIMFAVRLRTLRRLLATCVVVPSRLTDDRWEEGALDMQFRMTFEYSYAGRAYECIHTYSTQEHALIGSTPELLVPPSSPQDVLIRDFYT